MYDVISHMIYTADCAEVKKVRYKCITGERKEVKVG